jgi:hypothetical protein
LLREGGKLTCGAESQAAQVPGSTDANTPNDNVAVCQDVLVRLNPYNRRGRPYIGIACRRFIRECTVRRGSRMGTDLNSEPVLRKSRAKVLSGGRHS